MKANTIKNISLRKQFKKIEINSRINKFVYINLLNSNLFKTKLSFQYFLNNNFIPKSGSKTYLKNKCVLTGKTRSVNRKLNLSRMQLRHLISFGIIPGYQKSVW